MEDNPMVNRLFKNVYVCKKCGHKMRADPMKVMRGLIKCRNCKRYDLRPKRWLRKK
jgi:ribosomal protein L40E